MATPNIPLKCNQCKNKFPLKEMRYNREGTQLICQTCFEGQSKPKEVKLRKSKDLFSRLPLSKDPRYSENKIKYTCSNCHYRFSRAEGFDFGNTCPYCGKKDYIKRDSETHTSTLLKL